MTYFDPNKNIPCKACSVNSGMTVYIHKYDDSSILDQVKGSCIRSEAHFVKDFSIVIQILWKIVQWGIW